MAFAGPRLDRPSAVGDEGRPRAVSLTVAALVVVGLAVAAFVLVDRFRVITALALAVALLVGGTALLTRRTVGEQVVGHLLYHPGAIVGIVLVVTAWGVGTGLLRVGVLIALFGIAGAWSNVLVEDDVRVATVAAVTSYGLTLGWLVVVIVVLWLAVGTWTVTAGLLETTDPVDSLYGFLGFVAIAGLLVRGAIWALPIEALTPRPRREARRARLAAYSRAGTAVAVGAIATVVLTSVVGGRTIHRLAIAYPGVEVALTALSSPLVLLPVVAVCAIGVAATVTGMAAREVASHVDAGNIRLLSSAIAGLVFALLIAGYLSDLVVGLIVLAPIVLGLALVAPLLAITVGFLGLAAMESGFLPGRATGPSLAATGLFLSGIGAATVGLPAVLVFAFVAGAVVVWDVSTFGLGLTVELGHRPSTRRLELYHAVLSVGVGLAAVAAATGLDLARRSVGSAVGAWPAVAVAVLGAIVLVLAVSRREA